MSSRSTRRAQSSPSLTSIEALLLAQASWEFGAVSANWSLIAKLLSKHPLLSRPKSFFTAQSCHAMYEHLLQEAGLELTEANYIPHAETNLSLAQRHYRSRVEELRELIVVEESKFKAILREIEDIRTGIWDSGVPSRRESEVEKPGSEKNAPMAPRGKNRPQDDVRIQDIAFSVSGAFVSPNPIESESPQRGKPTNTFRRSVSRLQDRRHASLEELSTSRQDEGRSDQRQEEEEEEELEIEEENKEEEEETSQGQGELEVDKNEDDAPASPKSAVFSMGTDSDQPPEKQTSDLEEPVAHARRSTRRRKSSTVSAVSHAPVRTRQRARGRAADEIQTVESDFDESKDNVSVVDDEGTSSPFDSGAISRRDGKRKASLADSVDSPQERKRPREDSEPVEEEEPGPSVHNTRARTARNTTKTEEQVALRRFQNVIGMLHSQISQHRNGTVFHLPIKPSEAPDYQDIVKRPMDLKTIKSRVKDGIIGNSLEFQRDIYLMFANAMMYNRPGSDIYMMAENMMLESEAQINTFRQTEGFLSVRRGHR